MLKIKQFTCRPILNRYIILTSLSVLLAAPLFAKSFEPEVVKAPTERLLDKKLLKGPLHVVANPTVIKGLTINYRIDSSFGSFTASGKAELTKRLHEIKVIAALREIDKTELVAESASKTLARPIEGIQQVVTEPVGTIKGVPQGVSRWFKRTSRKIGDAYESAKEYSEQRNNGESAGSGDSGDKESVGKKAYGAGKRYLKKFLGLSSAYRSLAREYQVDPYSDNQMLRNQLEYTAQFAAAGSFGVSRLDIAIPGELGNLQEVGDMVWNSDPLDLLIRNEETAKGLGISAQSFERFFGNDHYSLTAQTRAIEALKSLEGAAKRVLLLDYAAEAESRQESGFLVRMLEMMSAYHRRSPLEQIVLTSRLPIAVDGQNHVLLFLPVDYLRWTKLVGEANGDMIRAVRKLQAEGQANLWIDGTVSKAAATALQQSGWTIHTDSLVKLRRQ